MTHPAPAINTIIQLRPARVTPRGSRPATYLARIDYPPLLADWSKHRPTAVHVAEPAVARRYTSPDTLESALTLLRTLGYDPQPISVQ